MRLSVVIPAYNESKRITNTLEAVNQYLMSQPYDYEIIIIANNCTDDTVEVAKNLQKTIANMTVMDVGKTRGKGEAVKKGFMNANGDFVMFMDADNATKITELDHFWQYFDQGFDVVIGSRDIKGAKVVVPQPWYKELAGKIGNLFIQLMVLPGIKDTQCGFKMFKQNVAKDVFSVQKLGGWGFDMEILALAKRMGFKIKEEPVTWYNALGGSVKSTSYLKVFTDLFKVRWWLLTDKYKISAYRQAGKIKK